MSRRRDPFEDDLTSFTGRRLGERAQVLVMSPPQQWSNENLNFLVFYLKRALSKRFGFPIITSDELPDNKAIGRAVKSCPFVLIIFDRPTETIAYAYKEANQYDKPVFIIRAYAPEIEETSRGFDVPSGLLSMAIAHKELGTEEKTLTKLIHEMIIDRDKLVMEMFIQDGELRLDFFTELLKRLDSFTCRSLLKEMTDKFPHDKSFWLASGRAKMIEGDVDEALHDFDEATRISPTDPWVFSRKSAAMVDVGDFDTALKEVSSSIKLKPFNPEAFFIRGNAQYLLDNWDEALASFEEAHKQKPDFVSALNNLAHISTHYEKYKEALRLLDKAVELDRDYPFTYLNRAACLREMGRPKSQILAELRKAEKIALGNIWRGDDFERSAYCLFYIYAAVGNIEKAIEYLQRCVDYHIPVKRWRTLERVWDENVQDNPTLKAIMESSQF